MMRVTMRGFQNLLPFTLLLILPLLCMPRVQASFEYAAACVPTFNDGYTPLCQLNIIAKEDSEIEIRTFMGTENFTLSAGSLYKAEFDSEFIPTMNTENKAIRVTSDEEIQVLVYYEADARWYQDVYMVPNQIRSNDTYYTSAYYRSNARQCISRYKQFYLVSSIYDETAISVTQQDGTTYDLELPAFGTFVQRTTDENNHLAMGTKITSNKPITVVAGNLCVYNIEPNTNYWGTYFSTMPDASSLGQDYIVPHITSDDVDNPAGYSIGVVATEDDTIVSSDGEMRSLNQGETTFFEYPLVQKSLKINCSKPCLVIQYTKVILSEYGLFMHTILPENQFSTSAFFTTLDSSFSQAIYYLSLVVQGESPGDDVYLDGTSLGHLTWTPIDGYSSAEVAIPKGAHELVSVNERPFAPYIYVQTLYAEAASGYAFLPYVSSRVTPEPTTPAPTTTVTPEPTTPPSTTTVTTPSPSVNGTLPQHTVRINGTAYSTDGEEISPSCVLAHFNNLDRRAKDMVVRVNAEIGKSICNSLPDILVVSSIAAMSSQYNKTLIEVYHVMRVQGHHVPDDVETCALEVGEYLSSMSHWQQPIFPDEPGCSRLEILPFYFRTSGTFWSCDNTVDEETSLADNILAYESTVSEVLSTQDGSSLSNDCIRSYITEVAKKTSSMMGEISAALEESTCDEIVMSVTHAEGFVAAGAQAFFQASFYYVPSPVASFAEFLVCMLQVHQFSLQHDNWSPGSQPGAPFLPVPPGCPLLEHDTDFLDDGGHKWTCV